MGTLLEWYENATHGESVYAVAKKAGVSQVTLGRQLKRGNLSVDVAVKVAHAYNLSPFEPLILAGIITREDLATYGGGATLDDLADETLLAVLGERLQQRHQSPIEAIDPATYTSEVEAKLAQLLDSPDDYALAAKEHDRGEG